MELPFSPKQETPESRRSKSIDDLIRKEQQQPWTRSDVFMAHIGPDRGRPFKHSLCLLACDDKQKYADALRRAAMDQARGLLESFERLDMASVPDEARVRALELQTLLAPDDAEFTDEALDLFEYLWGLKSFRPTARYGSRFQPALAV